MKQHIAVGIQSSVYPPDPLPIQDWRLYLKVRSLNKIKMVRQLNIRINEVLQQRITN